MSDTGHGPQPDQRVERLRAEAAERREQLRAEAAERLRLDAAGIRFCRLDELYRLAELNASYWHSIALAVERDDLETAFVHCRQVAMVTREAFALAKKLGADGGAANGQCDGGSES